MTRGIGLRSERIWAPRRSCISSSAGRPLGAIRLVIPRWASLKSKVGRRLLSLFISCAIVPLVIALFLSFFHVTDKLQVVAEGVETEQQLARLREINFDTTQGFLFSEPVPADGFEKLLLESGIDA